MDSIEHLMPTNLKCFGGIFTLEFGWKYSFIDEF